MLKAFLFLKNITLSRYTNFLIIVIIIYSAFNNKYWKEERGVIYHDVKTYYLYLPATFVYNDITFQNYRVMSLSFLKGLWVYKTDKNCYISKMTMGMSVLYSPFFFIAHSLAKPLGYKPDGFTLPYQFAISMGCIVYLIIGLFFLRKVLERYFSQLTVSFTLFSIALCTNLTHYAIQEPGMTHVYNFTLFAIFLFLIFKWYEKLNYLNSVYIGFIGGLITLIRPTNIIIFLVFLFIDCITFKDIKERFVYLLKSYKKIIIILIVAFLVWLPQFIYWKVTTGQYLYYTYRDEHFFFNNPHIIKGLFGFRKGWLLYTPIMIFAIIGIVFLKDNLRKLNLSISLFVIINIYVILSWWCWWYGGGLSNRAFIDSYPLLSIPLAAFIQWTLYNKRKFLRFSFLFLIILFNSLGIYYTLKYHYGSLHWGHMTKEAYWHSFDKLRPDDKFYKLLKEPDDKKAKLEGKE